MEQRRTQRSGLQQQQARARATTRQLCCNSGSVAACASAAGRHNSIACPQHLQPRPPKPLTRHRSIHTSRNTAGFVPYAGEGFAILLPSKWNPSKEDDFGKFGKTELR